MKKSLGFALIAPFLFPVYLDAQKLNTARLDSLINAVDTNNKIMGALAISKNGRLLYNKAWGYREKDEKQELKADTRTKYRIGSITKIFTSVMILQLAEEGKISLDNKLSEYYPEIPNAEKISIRQLLNHHSGLYNFTDSTYLSYYTSPKTHSEMLVMFERQEPDFEPGEKGAYSNTNYVLLGYILEKITGKTYAQNLKSKITSKTGLKDTYYGSKAEPKKNEARSFLFANSHWVTEPETDMSIPGGAGAVVSTSADLVKFLEALFNYKLISKTSVRQMMDKEDGFGLGIFEFPFDEKKLYGHTGGIDEFHSIAGYFPSDSLAVAFTGNGQTIEANELLIGVLSIYFDRPYQIPDFKETEVSISEEKLSRYEGVYASSQLPLKISLKKEGNRLSAQATGQSAFFLTPLSETEFKFDPARLKIIFEPARDSTFTRFTLKQGGGSFLFEKEKN